MRIPAAKEEIRVQTHAGCISELADEDFGRREIDLLFFGEESSQEKMGGRERGREERLLSREQQSGSRWR